MKLEGFVCLIFIINLTKQFEFQRFSRIAEAHGMHIQGELDPATIQLLLQIENAGSHRFRVI